MNCMQFNETDQQVKLEFKDVSYFSSGEGGTSDHSKLINRDAADQHPMSAITGLEDALDGKQPTGDYLTEELDPTVPSWAKQPQKPAYTAQEVGALPDTTHIPSTAADVNAEPSGAVAQHNVSDAAHSDIRLLIQGLSERLSALADSDDTTLDQLSEIVAYIKSNRDLISALTTNKVSVSDIVDNLTTNVANKPLSAAQGVALKALIDTITVPTALSELTEDTTHRVVTDAEKVAWNAKSNFTGSYNDLTDKPTIPTALPTPNKLTFTGAVSAEFDGSEAVTVEIPEGGGSSGGSGGSGVTRTILLDVTTTEEVSSISGGALGADGLATLLDADEVLFYLLQVPTAAETVTTAGVTRLGIYKPIWYSWGLNLVASYAIKTPIYGQAYDGQSFRLMTKIVDDLCRLEYMEATSATNATSAAGVFFEAFKNVEETCYIQATTTTAFGVGTRLYVEAIKYTEG